MDVLLFPSHFILKKHNRNDYVSVRKLRKRHIELLDVEHS